ncbi:MAG: Uma2 family endonuclease [Planctomycetes bacterium]|nr:Uma2 family endonuclease [Planctomycetota bacterium]
MKAVLVHVTDRELAQRRRLGLDRYDEMWEGVLHRAPAPDYEHQRIKLKLCTFLDALLSSNARGLPALEVNVFDDAAPETDYRIPDIAFLAPARGNLLARDGIHGGPDAVIEIRSPEDETYAKFPFFEKLGVREVVVVHRDSKQPEVHRPAGGRLTLVPADPEGWVISEAIGIRLRVLPGDPAKLVVEDIQNPALRAEI